MKQTVWCEYCCIEIQISEKDQTSPEEFICPHCGTCQNL